MKQPKCRTCGKEHALGICPEFKSTAPEESRTSRSRSANESLPVDTSSKPFDRKKYQMLFMRDKRKADKLGLKVSEYRKMKGNE